MFSGHAKQLIAEEQRGGVLGVGEVQRWAVYVLNKINIMVHMYLVRRI